ncbi:MAG: hybrid sensor histidine kinase/response regulator [Ignavibacteriaceae bacterium]|nr:hybrid sensor histidine kinase/response regulator [Ignavibacteriaceae bacterium]
MRNLLLIETDNQTIEQIFSVFRSSDFMLDLAENCSMGYEIAIRDLPKLIICNMKLYESDGLKTLHRLKEGSYISTIPFIFILEEGQSNSQPKETGYDLDFYIEKPFTGKELIKITKIALERYTVLAEKTEKRLDELRGSISFSLPHELFTPLNGIIGFSEILIKDFDHLDREEIVQMLNYINSDALRLKKITKNFLAFAQLEMIGKDEEKTSSLRNSYFINPKEIIIKKANQIAKFYKREDDLVLEVADCVIRMTESYLKKLIAELIDNAFKFSKKGTSVIISLLSNDTSVMFSVTDSGRGMTAEQISSIGAYIQFDRKIHEQQGSGLGLVIAKKITEIHGGQFKIDSILNESTKITIIFDY